MYGRRGCALCGKRIALIKLGEKHGVEFRQYRGKGPNKKPHLFDDLRLHQKDFFIQRQTDRINAGGQRGQREKQIADRGLFRILEAFNGKSGFFRCHGPSF